MSSIRSLWLTVQSKALGLCQLVVAVGCCFFPDLVLVPQASLFALCLLVIQDSVAQLSQAQMHCLPVRGRIAFRCWSTTASWQARTILRNGKGYRHFVGCYYFTTEPSLVFGRLGAVSIPCSVSFVIKRWILKAFVKSSGNVV